jgi:hypothetical protein
MSWSRRVRLSSGWAAARTDKNAQASSAKMAHRCQEVQLRRAVRDSRRQARQSSRGGRDNLAGHPGRVLAASDAWEAVHPPSGRGVPRLVSTGGTGHCSSCGRTVTLRLDGKAIIHKITDGPCPGSVFRGLPGGRGEWWSQGDGPERRVSPYRAECGSVLMTWASAPGDGAVGGAGGPAGGPGRRMS